MRFTIGSMLGVIALVAGVFGMLRAFGAGVTLGLCAVGCFVVMYAATIWNLAPLVAEAAREWDDAQGERSK